MAETDWISAAEAARRLGIKQATLYSYVSRGVLTRRRAGGTGTGGAGGGSGGSGGGRGSRGGGPGQGSLFDPGEVEELARRGRPRRAPGLAGLVIESGVTEITDDGLWFRGMDALDLARDWDFEDVCDLLWVGQPYPSAPADAGEWQASRASVAARCSGSPRAATRPSSGVSRFSPARSSRAWSATRWMGAPGDGRTASASSSRSSMRASTVPSSPHSSE